MAEVWRTAVTDVAPNRINLRGYPVAELAGARSFAEVMWLALKGELPTATQGRMLDAILVSSVDHGVTPPSTLAVRTAASTGAPLNAALAAGALAVNRHHGGAVEDCMRALAEAAAYKDKTGGDDAAAAAWLLNYYRERGRRVAGFGHRFHSADPRSQRLLGLARELGVAAAGVGMARAVEEAFAAQDKPLPLNVDGAIAACLLDLGIEPEVANAFFIIARMPGWLAHAREEWAREKPMRRIEPSAWEYDGPAERHL